jgi:hypothetical protein
MSDLAPLTYSLCHRLPSLALYNATTTPTPLVVPTSAYVPSSVLNGLLHCPRSKVKGVH